MECHQWIFVSLWSCSIMLLLDSRYCFVGPCFCLQYSHLICSSCHREFIYQFIPICLWSSLADPSWIVQPKSVWRYSCWFTFWFCLCLKGQPGELYKWLHRTGSCGILSGLHFYADFYDSRNCFYVITCWSPFRGLQRCSSCCVHSYCGCIFLLLLVQTNWPTPRLLSVAWQIDFLSGPGDDHLLI